MDIISAKLQKKKKKKKKKSDRKNTHTHKQNKTKQKNKKNKKKQKKKKQKNKKKKTKTNTQQKKQHLNSVLFRVTQFFFSFRLTQNVFNQIKYGTFCCWQHDVTQSILRIKQLLGTAIRYWAAPSEFGIYRLCEQWRFRRACAFAQSRQNLRCSLIQAVSQEEHSDGEPDPWPVWMAGHAQLKFVMKECSKTQICLTRPILDYCIAVCCRLVRQSGTLYLDLE